MAEDLGHNSAVHAAYAKTAEVRVPSLDQWEKQMESKVVEVQFMQNTPEDSKDRAEQQVIKQQLESAVRCGRSPLASSTAK